MARSHRALALALAVPLSNGLFYCIFIHYEHSVSIHSNANAGKRIGTTPNANALFERALRVRPAVRCICSLRTECVLTMRI